MKFHMKNYRRIILVVLSWITRLQYEIKSSMTEVQFSFSRKLDPPHQDKFPADEKGSNNQLMLIHQVINIEHCRTLLF